MTQRCGFYSGNNLVWDHSGPSWYHTEPAGYTRDRQAFNWPTPEHYATTPFHPTQEYMMTPQTAAQFQQLDPMSSYNRRQFRPSTAAPAKAVFAAPPRALPEVANGTRLSSESIGSMSTWRGNGSQRGMSNPG